MRLFCTLVSLGYLCSCAKGDFSGPSRNQALSVDALLGTWTSTCSVDLFITTRDVKTSYIFAEDIVTIQIKFYDSTGLACTESALLVTIEETREYWMTEETVLPIPEDASNTSALTNYNFNFESKTLTITPTSYKATVTSSNKIAEDLNELAHCNVSWWQDDVTTDLSEGECHNTIPRYAKLRLEEYSNGSADGLAISTSSTLVTTRPQLAGNVTLTKE